MKKLIALAFLVWVRTSSATPVLWVATELEHVIPPPGVINIYGINIDQSLFSSLSLGDSFTVALSETTTATAVL